VHWPFCLSKCPYCDFNSHVVESVDHGEWRDGLLRELAYYAELTPGRRLSSIFFGGGTPSLMQPSTAAALINSALEQWETDQTLEITLEANPGAVDIARFAAFRTAGVTRMSIGVQSLDEDELVFLGRKHSAQDAVTAVKLAGQIFKSVSMDLIYALPGQSVAKWKSNLDAALRLSHDVGCDHLSAYQLTIEPNTPFHTAHAVGKLHIPDDDHSASLYELTQTVCNSAGLPGYEVSNHAAPGKECRHNMTYWRGGDYAGIGPGAHGRISIDGRVHAIRQIKAPGIWLKRVFSKGHGTHEDTVLSQQERIEELLLMGSRLAEGLNKARFYRYAGLALDAAVNKESLEMLSAEGFIQNTPEVLRVTSLGRLTLNTIIAALVPD